MRPWCMKPTRLARSASSRYAVVTKTVRPSCTSVIENRPEIAARNGIDAVGRLVQKQNSGLVQQRAHQREFLFHAAGKLAGLALRNGVHARHAQQACGQFLALLPKMPNRSA